MLNQHDTVAPPSNLVLVAHAFSQYETGTASEVMFASELDRRNDAPRSYHLRSEVADLESMGLLRIVGKRPCEITGRPANVLAWDPNGIPPEMPVSIELSGSAVEMLDTDPEAIIAAIKAEASNQRAARAKMLARRSDLLALVHALNTIG